jgi:1-acyl-sn-glycerol-3-phosphate acyltransferase
MPMTWSKSPANGTLVASIPDVMDLDGFVPSEKDAFVGFSASVSERFFSAIDVMGRKLGVDVQGIDLLPDGGALLVANHTFGWDTAFAVARIRARTGRTVWALGEHLWWRVPLLRRLASAVGIVDGTPENVDALLAAGELVLVLPGGLREAVKPRELRYRLLWGHRYGFVHAAMRNGVPLVPLACIGGDDVFSVVGDAFARGKRLHLPIPLPRIARPHRAPLRFVIGEPIPLDGRSEDDGTVRRIRREVEGALHELFEIELARRVGFCA